MPTAIGEPLQTTSTVLVAPSGLANVSSSDGGDVSTVLPAAGDDETSVLSAASTFGTANAPDRGDADERGEGDDGKGADGAYGRGGPLHAGSSTLEDGRERPTPPDGHDQRADRSAERERTQCRTP